VEAAKWDVLLPERLRSMARDLRQTTPPDFIASPLHRLVPWLLPLRATHEGYSHLR
jgi:hypothetical protein